MYQCSICQKEAQLNEDGYVRTCDCKEGNIICGMESNLEGKGGIKETKEIFHNLSESSFSNVQAMLVGLASVEFFQLGKKEIFANEMTLTDTNSKRTFTFTLTAKEL